MSGPDIFLSYNREDAARAKHFADAFAAEGFDVWWDAALRSGEAYDRVTEEALRAARAVVVLWSKRSVESRWVRAEATEADRGNKLVPVMIEPCKRPIMFELTHTAELSHWHGNRSDPAWRTYVEDLRRLVGGRPKEDAEQPDAAGPVVNWRGKRVLAAVAGGILLLLIGGAWFLHDRSESGATATKMVGERVPVLVHAFTGGSGDKNEAELASGLSDELIVRLRQVPELRIGGEAATASAGSVFANAYIVDGNVRRDGDRVRVTAQLLSQNGEVVWSQSYDRTMSDLFSMQEQIASAIASALSVSLDVGSNSSRYGGTDNPDAFAAFMQFKANQFNFDQSVPRGYLERAIALDPHYLKALSALSDSYSPKLAYASSKSEQDALLAEMDASTSKMLAANPDVWMSHFSRAVYFISREDFLAARQEVDLAQKFDRKTDPELPAGLATLDFALGYKTQANSLFQSAQAIDPT